MMSVCKTRNTEHVMILNYLNTNKCVGQHDHDYSFTQTSYHMFTKENYLAQQLNKKTNQSRTEEEKSKEYQKIKK